MTKKKKPAKKPKKTDVEILADEPAGDDVHLVEEAPSTSPEPSNEPVVVENPVATPEATTPDPAPVPASEAAGLPPPPPELCPPPAAAETLTVTDASPQPEPVRAPAETLTVTDAPPQSEPLRALKEKANRTSLLALPPDRAEAARLALSTLLSRPVPAFTEVDARGLPPSLTADLAGMLVHPPPFGLLLLASREQRTLPIHDPLHSFEETLLTELFRRASATLDLVLERTLVTAELHPHPTPRVPEDLLLVEEVRASLDTAGNHLSSIASFEGELVPLTRDPDALLDEDRVDRLVARAQELSAALGDLLNAGLTGPVEVPLALGSFWTAWYGGVYRLASRPPLLVYNPQRTSLTGAEIAGEALRLTDPGLIDRLHASGFLTFDHDLVEPRTRELEDEALLAQGVDPSALDDAERRRAVAARARTMPRTWHEMVVVRRALQGGPSGARVIHTLSAETKVKLSRPLKDVPVVSRLLAELDSIDYPRLFTWFPERFERDFLAASEPRREHMVRSVMRALAPPPPEAPPREEAPPEPADDDDDDEIQFL